jgi:hypothetical protein
MGLNRNRNMGAKWYIPRSFAMEYGGCLSGLLIGQVRLLNRRYHVRTWEVVVVIAIDLFR